MNDGGGEVVPLGYLSYGGDDGSTEEEFDQVLGHDSEGNEVEALRASWPQGFGNYFLS